VESAAGAATTALQRVSFEKSLADARRYTQSALASQVELLAEFREPAPSLLRLHQLSSAMAVASAAAEDAFGQVFAVNPQSVLAMRLLAQYHMAVTNNVDKATAISAEAERLEEAKAKEATGTGGLTQPFGLRLLAEVPAEQLQSDSVAVLTASAASRDLGSIITANAAACRMLGYTRVQLVRRSINLIMPEPLASECPV